MSQPIVFMFSGQGSQYYQMGKELFNSYPVFRDTLFELDEIARKSIGISVVDEIYHPSKRLADRFDTLLHTHPAIFMIEYALYRLLVAKKIIPNAIVGMSLGEFTAAAIAGVLSVEETLELIIQQAHIVERWCQKGAMIAIMDHPSLFHNTPLLHQNTEFVAHNFDSHFVISGIKESIDNVVCFLKRENILHQILPVHYGFHSSSIEAAYFPFANLMNSRSFHPPALPLFSSSKGDQMIECDRKFFWDVVSKPFHFQKAQAAIEAYQPHSYYIDLSPSSTLATFTKHLLSESSRIFPIMTPFHLDRQNFEKLICLNT